MAKKAKNTLKERRRTDIYWICSDCATKKKWTFPEYPVTVIEGLCGHCKRSDKVSLTPTCDFKQSKTYRGWD